MPIEIDLDAYYGFDAGSGSGIPTEDVWEEYFKHLLLDGVLAGEPAGTTPGTTELQVYADSTGMQVKVRIGRGLMKGHVGWTTSEKTLTVPTAHATLARIDAVVQRLDRTNNKMRLQLIQGTASVSPAVPSITQNATIHDEMLAEVDVAAATSTIAAAAVRDKRRWAIPDTRGLPTVRVARTTDLTGITTGSETAVTWEAATYQTGGAWWSASLPTRVYVPRPGLYRATGRIRWDANASGIRQVSLRRNGTETFALNFSPAATVEVVQECSDEVVCAAGDYLELTGLQTSGSNRTMELRSYAPRLSVFLVRAA